MKEKTDSLHAKYEWLHLTARRTRRLVLFCSDFSNHCHYLKTIPSVAHRLRLIPAPRLQEGKSKASSMGSLSVSLFLSPMLLLRYYQSRSYSTLPTSASLAPSVVSYSLDQFLRRRFSNLTLPVRLYHHLGSSGKLFDMYSYTLHTLLRRSTTLCTHTSRIQSLHTSDNLLVPSRKSYSFVHRRIRCFPRPTL